jgi:hypothetical protein
VLRAVLILVPIAVALSFGAVAAEPPRPAFAVVSEDGGDDRRGISVRLKTRLTETELRRIADAIVDKRRARAGRTTIRFYLDGMPLDGAAWAQATYATEVKLAIAGLSLEEEQMLLAELRTDQRQIVGAWLTSPPAAPGRLVIFRDKGRTFAEWRLRSGLKTVDEVAETKVARGRRYEIAGETRGHFLATSEGPLELREGEKLIAVAERVVIDKLLPAAASAGRASPAAAPSVAASPSVAAAPERGVADSGPKSAAGPQSSDTVAAPVPGQPVTGAVPRPVQKKKVARQVPSPPAAKPFISASRQDSGPIMRLPGQ